MSARRRLSGIPLGEDTPWTLARPLTPALQFRCGAGGALRCGAVLAFARMVDLVGALARPLAAGAVAGGVQLVGNLRP